jgi:hypothetical protein
LLFGGEIEAVVVEADFAEGNGMIGGFCGESEIFEGGQ